MPQVLAQNKSSTTCRYNMQIKTCQTVHTMEKQLMLKMMETVLPTRTEPLILPSSFIIRVCLRMATSLAREVVRHIASTLGEAYMPISMLPRIRKTAPRLSPCIRPSNLAQRLPICDAYCLLSAAP